MLPDRLEVRITERTPFAVWRLGARHVLIDKTGRVLAAVPPDAMPALPRIAGEGAATEAAALLALLAGHPALAAPGRGRRARRRRRWTLRLAGGGTIQLPADGEAEALAARPRAGRRARARHERDRPAGSPGRTLVREAPGAAGRRDGAPDARMATGGI